MFFADFEVDGMFTYIPASLKRFMEEQSDMEPSAGSKVVFETNMRFMISMMFVSKSSVYIGIKKNLIFFQQSDGHFCDDIFW